MYNIYHKHVLTFLGCDEKKRSCKETLLQFTLNPAPRGSGGQNPRHKKVGGACQLKMHSFSSILTLTVPDTTLIMICSSRVNECLILTCSLLDKR